MPLGQRERSDIADAEAPALGDLVERAVGRVPASVSATWRRLRATPAGAEAGELVAAVAVQGGGKHLRARLACAAYLGLGGTSEAVCDALGSAVQLLHLGLCIHDDLIDGDDRRHGRPNVVGTVRAARTADGDAPAIAERQASAAGLLAGDLAIGASVRALAGAALPPGIRSDLTLELLDALDETIAGEWLDVRGEQQPVDEARPVRTAELKTARYSVVLPLRLGAIASGGADAAVLSGLSAYGRHLGVAYQLKDDELAVFGDPARTGKSVSSDLRGGKRTALLQLALDSADPAARRVLDRDVGRADLPEAGVERIRVILRECGALEAHRDLIVEHAAAAVSALESARLPAGLHGYLQVIARAVPGRSS